MRLDEETLKTASNMAQAEYFHASNAQDNMKVYPALNAPISHEKKETESAALFAMHTACDPKAWPQQPT